MLSYNLKRWICVLFATFFLLLPPGYTEEAVETEKYVAELGEVDLLSPEINSEDLNSDGGLSENPPVDVEAPDVVSETASDATTEEAHSAYEQQSSEVSAVPGEVLDASGDSAVAAPTEFLDSLTLGIKEQAILNGSEISGGLPVYYVSTRPKVATVDENGTVVARRRGETTITCYQGELVLGECHVSVLKAPKKIQFPDKSIVLSKDQALAYPAIIPKGCAGAILYTSDNPLVLSVDTAGNLTGLSGGTATLTATAYNGKTARCSVRVLGGPAPSWMTLNETSLLLPLKGTAQLTANYDEGRDALLTFVSSNKKVARVSEDGVITARKAGNATITVTTHNGLTATCDIQVYTAPKSVKLNTKKRTLNVNDAFQLIATLPKYSISEIIWASDNPAVATVDVNGLVIAEGAGKAKITATTSNGKRATCQITVKSIAPQELSVDGVRGKVIFHEESETLKVTIANDKGVYLTYIWAENPSRQLFKQYGNSQPGNILQNAVNSRGLQGKIVVGFNASPPVNTSYYADWNRDANYHYREPSPLMIANGEVLVNDPTKINEDKYLYWLDGNGQLRYSEQRIEDMTVEGRRNLYSEVIASGAQNTMIWQPVLISHHQATYLSAAFLKRRAGNQKKQAMCQMDDNSFIIVSSSESGKMTYPSFQKYLLGLGCKTAVEFDAGGSTSLLFKSKTTGTVQRVTGGGRSLTMVMYFTE